MAKGLKDLRNREEPSSLALLEALASDAPGELLLTG